MCSHPSLITNHVLQNYFNEFLPNYKINDITNIIYEYTRITKFRYNFYTKSIQDIISYEEISEEDIIDVCHNFLNNYDIDKISYYLVDRCLFCNYNVFTGIQLTNLREILYIKKGERKELIDLCSRCRKKCGCELTEYVTKYEKSDKKDDNLKKMLLEKIKRCELCLERKCIKHCFDVSSEKIKIWAPEIVPLICSDCRKMFLKRTS